MTDLREREARAEIEEALASAKAPAMMLSFGKDSLVLAHLLSSYGVRRAFFVPHDDELGDDQNREIITERYDLEVMTLPLGRLILAFTRAGLQMVNLVPITPTLTVPFFSTAEPYDGSSGEPSCIDEQLRAAEGWVPELEVDVLFWGNHRSDPLHGGEHGCLPSYRALSRAGQRSMQARIFPASRRYALPSCGVTFSSPLFAWSPGDVWEYIDAHALPFSRAIYGADRRRKLPARACFRCHDPREQSKVTCPLTGKRILNGGPWEQALGVEVLRRIGVLSPAEARELSNG